MKKGANRWMRKGVVCLLAFDLIFGPTAALASDRYTGVLKTGQSISSIRDLPMVSSTELPTLLDENDIGQGIESIETDDASSTMTVTQDEEKASIEWATFNIGEDAEVCFDQDGNANWYVLNRIYDANPSQIFGRLTGDGKIYLINQNGFLFGETGQVASLHTLVASALNIAEDDFNAGINEFYQEDYRSEVIDDGYDYDPEAAYIEIEGQILTQDGGAVFMLAPTVVNSGSITAPSGQVGLVAGTKVTLYEQDETVDRTELGVIVEDDPGTAVNYGSISASQGVAGMYGAVVNQEGLITSVTAVYKSGTIELMASEKITTSEDSYTGCPLSDSGDTVSSSFDSGQESTVTLTGLEVADGEYDYPEVIEHNGTIQAKSGMVTLEANDRVFLDSGSTIDVSGAWEELSASVNAIEVQLNSVELSDEFIARLGDLKGETIVVNMLEGTDIGHIDGYLDSREQTIAERSTSGGKVVLEAMGDNGEVIVKDGATIDFSGGGIHYSAASIQTSKVRIDGAVYDISDIPDEILEIADEIELVSADELGQTDVTYIDAYDEGADAGMLTIYGDTVVLDGSIDGSVTVGEHQTLAEEPTVTYGEGDDAITYQTASGLKEPEAGTLVIGDTSGSGLNVDRGTDNLVVRASGTVLSSDFDVDDELEDDTTVLSADILNAAGLGNLELYANLSIVTKAGATLELAASHGSGELNLVARRIIHRGDIIAPGCNVTLNNDYNYTSELDDDEMDVEEGIWLIEGSSIDVSGETRNLKNASTITSQSIHLEGGTISLTAGDYKSAGDTESDSEGVFITSGAALDVSGGYLIDADGEVSGGNAGSLSISGDTIQLDGSLSGTSLEGYEGGTLSITARRVGIYDTASEASSQSSGLALVDDQLVGTGFSSIQISSYQSIFLYQDAWLTPSLTKFNLSAAYLDNTVTLSYSEAQDYDQEATSVELVAGTGNNTNSISSTYGIRIYEDAGIIVDNGGSISLTGASIDIRGGLKANGGKVSVEAEYGDLELADSAYIDASGYAYQEEEPLSSGMSLPYSVVGGGDVSLSAIYGSVAIASGASIDVSGSESVVNYYRDIEGKTRSLTLAAEAGSIAVTGEELDISGELVAKTYMDSLAGGTLSFTLTDTENPLLLSAEDLLAYTDPDDGNFDALSLTSLVGMEFDQGVTLELTRSLTLDAPYIQAVDGETLHFISAQVSLQNTIDKYALIINTATTKLDATGYFADPLAETDGSSLVIDSQWLDVTGNVALSGFETVSLYADSDLTLTDESYVLAQGTANPSEWYGKLYTYADMTISANRIYPTTDTAFTITTTGLDDDAAEANWIGGDLVIEQAGGSASDGAILSANGELTLRANQITVNGTLLAPMGRLELIGVGDNSSIVLNDGSTLSTVGNAAVVWGTYSGDLWTREDKETSDDIEIEEGPETGILLSADAIEMKDGALVDVSGGGIVYAYDFQASINGSADPLGSSDRYVIVLDNSVSLSGDAIYIPEGYGIPAGYYSILPEEYAFLTNAYIVEDLGTVVDVSRVDDQTASGYDQVVGYFGINRTGIVSSEAHVFSIRLASDVLDEGLYAGDAITNGDGGTLTISANLATLEGTLKGEGLDSYEGGSVILSAANVVIGSQTLAEWLAENEASYTDGLLYLQADALSGGGFASLEIGYINDPDSVESLFGEFSDYFSLLDDDDDTGSDNQTQTITISADTLLQVDALGIYATDSVIIDDGAVIETDELLIANTAVDIQMAASATIDAGALGIFAQSMDMAGTLTVADALAVGSVNEVALVGQDVAADSVDGLSALEIDAGVWQQFADIANVAIASESGITVIGEIEVKAGDLLYLNTPQIDGLTIGDDANGQPTARFSAGSIALVNLNDAGQDSDDGQGTLSFEADEEIWIGPGSIVLNGFGTIDFNAGLDVYLAGSGSLTAKGDLTFTAASITATSYTDDDGNYSATDYIVDAGNYALEILANGQTSDADPTPGGSLTFQAESIYQTGVIDNFAGDISLIADSGIVIAEGAEINAQGGVLAYEVAGVSVAQAYGAGSVYVDSGDGAFELADGAVIDVSNYTAEDRPDIVDEETWEEWIDADYLDAGEITIESLAVAAIISGELNGQAAFGQGGSLDLASSTIDDFSTLSELLAEGGMNGVIAMRAASGSIFVEEGDTLVAEQIKLTADGGAISVYGTLNVSGEEEDRSIALYAADDVILYSDSLLDAHATADDSDGGQIVLSSTGGVIDFQSGAVINVAAGGEEGTTGGTVRFRSLAEDSDGDAEMDEMRLSLAGEISGASSLTAEGVLRYDESGDETISTADISGYHADADVFLANIDVAALTADLVLTDSAALEVKPGIEVTSSGDLTLASEWNLSELGKSDQSGTITLRAAGNIDIEANLVDDPHTDVELLTDDTLYDSWGLVLTAGADLNSADPLAVTQGTGSLTVEDGCMIYTESNTIQIGTGGDILVGKGYYDTLGDNYISYSIATHDGDIEIVAGGDLTLSGDNEGEAAAIQTHTGDIFVDVQGNIEFGIYTAIRTLGWVDMPSEEYMGEAYSRITDPSYAPDGYDTAWQAYLDGNEDAAWVETYVKKYAFDRLYEYSGGGDISVSAGGSISGAISPSSLYLRYKIGTGRQTAASEDPDYAGASYFYVYSRTGSTFPAAGIVALSGGDVTVVAGDDLEDVQVAAFETGDLTVLTGGDADGRFLIEDGRASIMSMQNYGAQSTDRAIEVIDSGADPAVSVSVVAQGDIHLGTVLDPFMADLWEVDTGNDDEYFNFQYTEETTLSLTAINGDVTIIGETEFYDPELLAYTALPPNVEIVAGGDIVLANDATLWLTPSSTGGLTMIAGGSIIGDTTTASGQRDYAQIVVSNLAPEQIYSYLTLPGLDFSQLLYEYLQSFSVYGDYDGFLTAYIETFEAWWDEQDEETKAEYQDLYDRIYDSANLHEGDSDYILIKAGDDITNLAISTPKSTQIIAGGSVTDTYFRIQHTDEDDVSVVAADGSIEFSPLPVTYQYKDSETLQNTYEIYLRRSGVELAGSGSLIVSAGDSIDLGLGNGIRSVGSTYNSDLSSEGASLYISAGYDAATLFTDDAGTWQVETAIDFFDALQTAGIEYSALKYGEKMVGDDTVETDIDWVRSLGSKYAKLVDGYDSYDEVPTEIRERLAELYLEETQQNIISPVLISLADGKESEDLQQQASEAYAAQMAQGIDFEQDAEFGEINMTQSQIFTQQYGDIYAFAASDFNVGETSFSDEKSNSGVNTMKGGSIYIFTEEDLNVDESRVMTWYGGDITIWANTGNINAGKGSKTTVSVSDPVKVYDEATDSYYLEYTLPAVGSGIRLLTYDPDGTSGQLEAPEAGTGYLFAPLGEIDAGEAGIVGQGNLLLAADVLTNTQNIDIGGISVGADINQDAGASVSGLSGMGAATVMDTKANEEMALSSARDRFDKYVAELSDAIVPRWLAVEVLGFVEDDEDEEKDE